MLVPQIALESTVVGASIGRPATQDVAMCYSFLDHTVIVGLFRKDRKAGRVVFYHPMILSRLERMRCLGSKSTDITNFSSNPPFC